MKYKIINLSYMDYASIQIALLSHAKEWVKIGREENNQVYIRHGLGFFEAFKKIIEQQRKGENK